MGALADRVRGFGGGTESGMLAAAMAAKASSRLRLNCFPLSPRKAP